MRRRRTIFMVRVRDEDSPNMFYVDGKSPKSLNKAVGLMYSKADEVGGKNVFLTIKRGRLWENVYPMEWKIDEINKCTGKWFLYDKE